MSTLAAIDPALRQELAEFAQAMCKELNDPKRLTMLYAPRRHPHAVTELSEATQVQQSNTSQHFAILRDRGLVRAERQDSKVVYLLRHRKIVNAIDLLRRVAADEVSRQQALLAPQEP
jgi:ArsR family transcriptional regulator